MEKEQTQVEEVLTASTQPESDFNPIFEEIKGITPEGAVNILIQAAGHAQSAGALTIRDSVMVATAISVLQPGTI